MSNLCLVSVIILLLSYLILSEVAAESSVVQFEQNEIGIGLQTPTEAKSSTAEDANLSGGRMRCMLHCMSLNRVALQRLRQQCHMDPLCIWRKAEFQAMRCVHICGRHEADSDLKGGMIVDWSPLKSSPLAITVPGTAGENNEFEKCFSDCMHISMNEILKLYAECHTDFKCWIKELGPEAAGCLVKCLIHKKHVDVQHIQVPGTAGENNEFEKCFSDCMHISMNEVLKLYAECHTDFKCWIKELGAGAAGCLVKCLIHKQPVHVQQVQDFSVALNQNDNGGTFVKCIAKCLGKSIPEVKKWYHECKKKVKCWLKKLGIKGAKCAGKCAFKDMAVTDMQETTSQVTRQINSVNKADNSHNLLKCLAKCLGKSLPDIFKWYQECHKDAKCWVEKAGPKAAECLTRCSMEDKLSTSQQSATEYNNKENQVLNSHNFLKCLAKCLGKSLPDIFKWYQECHKDVKCWVEKAGPKAAECITRCSMEDKLPSQVTGNVDTSDELNNGDKFLKCLAKCLDKALPDILRWYQECHKDAKCWAKKAGPKAAACLIQCSLDDKITSQHLVTDGSAEVTDVTKSRFAKCIAGCLGITIPEVRKLLKECHNDTKCWIDKVGEKGAACLKECTRHKKLYGILHGAFQQLLSDEQVLMKWRKRFAEIAKTSLTPHFTDTVSHNQKPLESVPLVCLARCLVVTLFQVKEWYNKCHLNWRCWMEEVGPKILGCVGECFLGKDYIPETIPHEERNAIQEEIKNLETIAKGIAQSSNEIGISKDGNSVDKISFSCLSKCLSSALSKVKQWFKECQLDWKCWVMKVGLDMFHCIGDCKKTDLKQIA